MDLKNIEIEKESDPRAGKIKKILAGTSITIISAIGINSGEHYILPKHKILDEMVTGYEYEQIREDIAGEFNISTKKNNQQVNVWADVITEHIKKCGGITLTKNTIMEINKFIYLNKCKL